MRRQSHFAIALSCYPALLPHFAALLYCSTLLAHFATMAGMFKLTNMLAGLRLPLLILALTGLTACRSLPPVAAVAEGGDWAQQQGLLQNMQDWQLRGRVNVRYQDEAHTPRIQWQQQGAQYQIRLWGTFNAGNTRINGGPGGVTLEQDGEVHTAPTPEQLILDYLGYELPVSYLEYWIKGLPASDSSGSSGSSGSPDSLGSPDSSVPPARLQLDSAQRLTGFTQAGWHISYTDPRQYGPLHLPRRVEVSNPSQRIRLRFIGLTWEPGG